MSNIPTPLRHKFPHVSQSVGDLASEAGSAASVLERGRLRGFGLGARARPAPGTHVGVEFVTGHVCVFLHTSKTFQQFLKQ